MFLEIGLSLVFAAVFVLLYVCVQMWRGRSVFGDVNWPRLDQPTREPLRSIGATKPKLMLTTEELSQHHSRADATTAKRDESLESSAAMTQGQRTD